VQNNAFALYGKEDLRPVSSELGELEQGGVLLRVRGCGVCGSDLRQYFQGPSPRYLLPAVLGHEIVGTVEKIGSSVQGLAEGDLVAVAPVIPCMNCAACRRGQDNLCERGQVIGVNVPGGMAEYIRLPARMVDAGGLAKVPQGVSWEAAALTEVLACCSHGLRQIHPQVSDDVLIVGEGPIGATFVQLLRLMGAARITVTGLNTYRLGVAGDLGADELLDASQVDLRAYAKQKGYAPDLAIIAAPSAEASLAALDIIRPGGGLLLFSGYPDGTMAALDLYRFHYGEKHIHGSIDATIADFQFAMKLQPQLKMAQLVTDRFPLGETPLAFQAGRDPKRLKVMVEP
jgi:L-iditol 2-dehydrogenase